MENTIVIEKKNTALLTLRVNYDLICKYDKLIAKLKLIDNDLNITRSELIRIILEKAIEKFTRDPRLLYIIIKNHKR